MFVFIVSYGFYYGFNMFDINLLAVFLNLLYLIVSDDGRQKKKIVIYEK